MKEIPDVQPQQSNPINSGVITIHGGPKPNQISSHSQKRLLKMPRCSGKDFEIICLIGRGDVGRVYLAKKSKDLIIPSARGQEYFAIKVMGLYDLKKRNKLKRFQAEYDILLAAEHPFINMLHCAFADERNYYLVSEYCQGGDLAGFMRLQPNKRFEEKVVLQYSAELVSAIEYLHYHGIIYRDLKTENVLVHGDGHLRLTDFDLAKRVVTERTLQLTDDKMFGTSIHEQSQSFVGTAEYLSPEMLKGEHSQATDFWTLGILMFELLYGVTPFFVPQGGYAVISRRIQSGLYTFPSQPRVSDHCKDLIKKLLQQDPKQRIGYQLGCSEIKKHPFFKNVNFAVVYPAAIKLDPRDLSQQQSPFQREPEHIAREFAGTSFKVPKKAQALYPQALKLIQQAGLPVNPKTIDILEQQELELMDMKSKPAVATYAGKNEQPKKTGVQDLFKDYKKAKLQDKTPSLDQTIDQLKAELLEKQNLENQQKDFKKVEDQTDIMGNEKQAKRKIQNEDSM